MKNHRFGYPILSTHRRLLKHAWEQDPALFGHCFLYTLAAAFYPFLAVLLPRYLLEELTRPAGARLQALALILGIFFLASALLGFCRHYIKGFCIRRFTLLRLNYAGNLCSKLMTIDYRYMEDAHFFDQYEQSFRATQNNGSGIEGNYAKMFEAPSQILTILILVLGKEIISHLKCMTSIIIVCIDNCKWSVDHIDTAHDRMTCAPWFHTSFRNLKAFRNIIQILMDIHDFHLIA